MSDDAVLTQKKLLAFLKRRHPDYNDQIEHWKFLEATYNGGRSWFTNGNIFKYIKEGVEEFAQRLERAYRFNHTREVVDLVQKYIFKAKVIRNEDEAPSELKAFWADATLSGLDIDQFMKLASTQASILGRPWIFTDSTKNDLIVSVADAVEAKARIYAYVIGPKDILDVGLNEQGQVTWVLVREAYRDDADPIHSSGALGERFRLWQPDQYALFEIIKDSNATETGGERVMIVDAGVNELGEIPGFPFDNVISENLYSSPALINDIAYLDRAIANYLSNLDAIIQDQTFSQLAMPAQNLLPGDDQYQKLIDMGTKRVFLYDGEGGVAPQYLSPDVKQAEIIVVVVNKIINEIYHSIGMGGERTKQDNAVGIDNSSGVAKAYDFERMNSLLTSKAASLENAENKLNRLIMLWNSKAPPEKELVKYANSFDVRSLGDDLAVTEKLTLVDGPHAMRREQMAQVIEKLFPRMSTDLKAKIKADLDNWPPEINLPVGERPLPPPTPGKPTVTPSKSKPKAEKRQGQVTK